MFLLVSELKFIGMLLNVVQGQVQKSYQKPITKGALSIHQKFRKIHVLNGTVHSRCTDPTQATARFVIVASQHTPKYALKEKSKYCLYPKNTRLSKRGGGKLKAEESYFTQKAYECN